MGDAVRRARQRGFTVLELVISTGIMTLVLLTAIGLLSESGRLLTKAQVEFAEPSVDLATRWLRRDLQGAEAVGKASVAIGEEPLDIVGNPEGPLRYELVGQRLDRVLLSSDGEEVGRRTLLRRVTNWEWRTVSSGLVEVEVTFLQRARSALPGQKGPQVVLEKAILERSFALRSRQRRFW